MMRLSDEQRETMLASVRDVESRMPTSMAPMTRLALDLAEQVERLEKELAAAQRREKRLRRQVELMGWLIGSHESDIEYIGAPHSYKATFDQMGDVTDVGEYTDDDLDMLKDHWPDAAKELDRRQTAADWPTGEGMQEIDERENPR